MFDNTERNYVLRLNRNVNPMENKLPLSVET